MKVCNICEYGSIYNSKKPFLWNVYLVHLETLNGYNDSYATFYDFGKTLFRSKEEADQALLS